MGSLKKEWMIVPIRSTDEYLLISWAIGRALSTFESARSSQYLEYIPVMPRLYANRVVMQADSLLIEELDYQLTVATRDDDDAAYFDPVLGDRLMQRIRQKVSDLRVKTLFACRFVRRPGDGGPGSEGLKLRLVS